jgi:class 3 adenylate cyclase
VTAAMSPPVPHTRGTSTRWTTVVMLMTDIVGSTRHWEQDEAAMSSALRWHDHLVRDIVEAAGGRLLKGHCGGDGTLSVFPSADRAVEAGLRMQQAMTATAWPTTRPLQMRVAIHRGRVERRDRDVFGLEVSRCARLCDDAIGGQVLVSAAAREDLAGDWRLVPGGARTLPGLAGHTVTFEILPPAPRSAERRRLAATG